MPMSMLSTTLWQAFPTACQRLRGMLFPPACVFCACPLERDADSAALPCCTACLTGIHLWPPRHCQRCGAVLPLDGQVLCGRCLRRPPAQVSTVSLFQYRGSVRQAILAWKLHGWDAAVLALLQVAETAVRQQITADDLLLPIPAPLARTRQHGMHHTAALCRQLARLCGCSWQWRWLLRQGKQQRQSALSASARRRNMRKAFALCDDYRPALDDYRRIWLVDDIITTGSTMHYAACCLRRQGVAAYAWSLAHTPDDGVS